MDRIAGVVALVAAGCRAPGAAQPPNGAVAPPANVAAATRFPSPARSFALPGADAEPVARDPDGTERHLVRGLRLTRHLDGSLVRARELLPRGNLEVVVLPERVGAGFLYHARTGSDGRLWRSSTWTGKLTPLARLGFDAEAVHVGFDRLYVSTRGSHELVALDAANGAVLDLGNVPTTMAVRRVAFVDAWFGMVDLPYRGGLVTFDAGASWHPLGLGFVRDAAVTPAGLRLTTDSGVHLVDAAGRLAHGPKQADVDEGDAASEAAPPRRPRPPLLREVVLRGWPVADDAAVALVEGTLTRVRLRDGAVLDSEPEVVDRGDSCQAIAFGGGFAFVCTREAGGTTLLRFRPPLAVEPMLSFQGPRAVSAGGTGALAIRGGCAETDPRPPSGLYCIVGAAGDRREIRVRGDRGVERVVARADGKVAVLVPPRFGAPGQLTVVGRDGTTERRALKLPSLGDARRALLRRGLWLDGFRELPGGELAGWIAGADTFVGVRIATDGRVKVGELGADLARTVFGGAYAVTLGRGGALRETTDGGFGFREVDPVLEFEPLLASPSAERGCSRLGFAVGDYLRVGWQGKRGRADALVEAKTPADTVFPAAEGGRWLLSCSFDRGRPAPKQVPASRPPAGARKSPRASAAARSTLTADTVETTDWGAFAGVAAPPLSAEAVGFDAEASGLAAGLRGYAWGPRGADWLRTGRFVVRALDAFALDGKAWSTAISPSPWPESVTAAQAFGLNVYGNPTPDWAVVLDPEGRAGVLAVSEPSGRAFFVVEEGRRIQRVPQGAALGVSVPAGAVTVGGRLYLGAARDSFRVYRVASDHLELVGDYPTIEGQDGATTAVLVRNARADGLALWVRAARVRGAHTVWYVFPINPATGEIEPPLVIAPRELSRVPPPCTEGDDGWILVGPPPIAPHFDVEGAELPWSPRRLDVRLRARPAGLCLDALTAEADLLEPGGPPSATLPTRRPVRLTVRTGDRLDGLISLLCTG